MRLSCPGGQCFSGCGPRENPTTWETTQHENLDAPNSSSFSSVAHGCLPTVSCESSCRRRRHHHRSRSSLLLPCEASTPAQSSQVYTLVEGLRVLARAFPARPLGTPPSPDTKVNRYFARLPLLEHAPILSGQLSLNSTW